MSSYSTAASLPHTYSVAPGIAAASLYPIYRSGGGIHQVTAGCIAAGLGIGVASFQGRQKM
eukprot:scaffold244511_cov30-Tisochrysis_lutea.AAC.1